MAAVLISLAILTVLVLIAVKIGFSKEDANIDPERERIIRVSGIYSVVRESPREGLTALRPKEGEVREYLAGMEGYENGARLTERERAALLKHWNTQMEANLQTIENGDKNGVTFYYYDFTGACPACEPFITKGNFVTREEIYKYPEIIPPFHIGCACALTAHRGVENLRETTITGMTPLFESEAPPRLPDWKRAVPLAAAEVSA
jgi:hypothetical protein